MAIDSISRQAAIDAFLTELTKRERKNLLHTWSTVEVKYFVVDMLEKLPSAQPDTSRIENILYGKSAEEQYNFLWWLMQDYGMQFTDTRSAVIEWLRGERNG